MQLTRNLGNLDRALRGVIGTILIVLAITGTIGLWGWLGVVLVATSFMSFCPIYRIFGLKTCSDC